MSINVCCIWSGLIERNWERNPRDASPALCTVVVQSALPSRLSWTVDNIDVWLSSGVPTGMVSKVPIPSRITRASTPRSPPGICPKLQSSAVQSNQYGLPSMSARAIE
jgi:hypothetical protein